MTRAKQFREALAKKHEVDCGLAMIVKQRAAANEIERMDLVGSVEGCDAIIGKGIFVIVSNIEVLHYVIYCNKFLCISMPVTVSLSSIV